MACCHIEEVAHLILPFNYGGAMIQLDMCTTNKTNMVFLFTRQTTRA
jgi:hypothetical protein